MRGRRWAVMAALVAAGSESRSPTTAPGRRPSPPSRRRASRTRARLEGATTTASLGAPAAAVWRRSIACASAAGLGALDVGGAQALGLRRLADADDLGVAGLLGAGRAELVERRLRSPPAARRRRRAGSASAAAGSSAGRPRSPRASPCRRRASRRRAGCPASARGRSPARRPRRWRSGSAPPTRVVFFVAKPGKPRPAAASSSSPPCPTTGSRPSSPPSSPPPPQPAAKASRTSSSEEWSGGHDRGHASRCPSRRPQWDFIRRRGRTCSSGARNPTISGWT